MQIHLVSGFLGSGKTTGIRTACEVLMSKGKQVAVITNDQGIRLVDTGYFDSVSIPNRQVVDGCFCCHYNALDANIQSLIEEDEPDLIFAESVGSCTDIVATVMKPLQQYRDDVEVTVSTFADAMLLKMLYVDGKKMFADEVRYIYQKQLEEAGIVVVTKVDLIAKDDLRSVQSFLKKEYPKKTFVYVIGTSADSVSDWLAALAGRERASVLSSLQIDYDTYGAGEAMLAWVDEELEVYSNNEKAVEDALALIDAIYKNIQENKLPMGHLKFLMDEIYKISYTATPEIQLPIELKPSSSSKILINARVETWPTFLKELIEGAVKETEHKRRCKIIVRSLSVFQPGYPKPTHRVAD